MDEEETNWPWTCCSSIFLPYQFLSTLSIHLYHIETCSRIWTIKAWPHHKRANPKGLGTARWSNSLWRLELRHVVVMLPAVEISFVAKVKTLLIIDDFSHSTTPPISWNALGKWQFALSNRKYGPDFEFCWKNRWEASDEWTLGSAESLSLPSHLTLCLATQSVRSSDVFTKQVGFPT